jgi:23S rRNA-/tRNA-specific pseudouridylate synthase
VEAPHHEKKTPRPRRNRRRAEVPEQQIDTMKKLPRLYPGSQDRRQPRFSRELSVLYEDDAIVALNKPAKLLAVPAENSGAPSALSLLSAELKQKRQRAFVVHRIDRYTSGILLFAKTWPDRQALVRQFLEHTPVRQYLAVVRGHLEPKEGALVPKIGLGARPESNPC